MRRPTRTCTEPCLTWTSANKVTAAHRPRVDVPPLEAARRRPPLDAVPFKSGFGPTPRRSLPLEGFGGDLANPTASSGDRHIAAEGSPRHRAIRRPGARRVVRAGSPSARTVRGPWSGFLFDSDLLRVVEACDGHEERLTVRQFLDRSTSPHRRRRRRRRRRLYRPAASAAAASSEKLPAASSFRHGLPGKLRSPFRPCWHRTSRRSTAPAARVRRGHGSRPSWADGSCRWCIGVARRHWTCTRLP